MAHFKVLGVLTIAVLRLMTITYMYEEQSSHRWLLPPADPPY